MISKAFYRPHDASEKHAPPSGFQKSTGRLRPEHPNCVSLSHCLPLPKIRSAYNEFASLGNLHQPVRSFSEPLTQPEQRQISVSFLYYKVRIRGFFNPAGHGSRCSATSKRNLLHVSNMITPEFACAHQSGWMSPLSRPVTNFARLLSVDEMCPWH